MLYDHAEIKDRVRHPIYGSGTILDKYIESNGSRMLMIEQDGDGDPNYSTAAEIIHCEAYEWEAIDA